MTALTERKQQCDSMLALLQVIPPQLQQMQNNINAVLQSVPIIDSVALDLREVKNALLQLQHQKDGQYAHFPCFQAIAQSISDSYASRML